MITKTHIDRVRSKMKENRVYINNTLDRTEDEAFIQIVDNGCLFLEKIYGYGTSPYIKHSRSKTFWNWYRLQWSACEDNFAALLYKNSKRAPVSILKNEYIAYLSFFCVASERIETAFKNYLKANK